VRKWSFVANRGVETNEKLDSVPTVELHTNISGVRTDRISDVPAEIATPVYETDGCRGAALVLHVVLDRHQLFLQLRHACFLR